MRTDGQTDIMLTVAARNFSNARSISVLVQIVLRPNIRKFVVNRVLQGVPNEHSQRHVGEVSFWASTSLSCKWWREHNVHCGGHLTIQ